MAKPGTPSPKGLGQYIKFQAAVLEQLPRPDEIDGPAIERWLKSQSKLKQVLRDALLHNLVVEEMNIDTFVWEVFTIELCGNQLGHNKGVRARFLRICREHEDFATGSPVRVPLKTLRDVARKTKKEWLSEPGFGPEGVRMIEEVLGRFGYQLGTEYP